MNTTTIYISLLLQLILVGSHLSASAGANITLYFEACDGSAEKSERRFQSIWIDVPLP